MSGGRLFPDVFFTKGPIPVKVTPFQYNNEVIYQARVVSNEADEVEERPKQTLKPYMDNDEELVDCTDMENYDIICTKSGKFQTSFYVPSCVHASIIGAKGSKLKELQKNTGTLIRVPRIGEKGDVIIIGDSERKVASARTQIAIIVSQRRRKMPPTHFIAIPINSQSITENLRKFQDSVLENPSRGVTKSIFQKPVKIHLTIVMLSLLDEQELIMAKKTLEDCYNEQICKVFEKGKKYKVTIQGLEIMNDDPSSVYVLYAKVNTNSPEQLQKLQEISDTILNYYFKADLAKREFDRVKLHMTLMNTSFRDATEKKESFDATEILKRYGDFYFGEFELNELDLCIRGTTTSATGEPKYYDTALKISL